MSSGRIRMIKVVLEVPCFPNIKSEERILEERRLIDLVHKHMRSNLVVDFGCGTGYYHSEDMEVVGIDLDEGLLAKAKLQHKVLADYKYAPFRENVFRAVVMCHSLEHTNIPAQPLQEAWRILEEGGVIGISVPNMRGLHTMFRLVFQGKLKGVGVPDHLTAFTPRTLRESLEQCGFRLIDESGDAVYFPFMARLKLMKLGHWLAKHIPGLANVYIAIGRKVGK